MRVGACTIAVDVPRDDVDAGGDVNLEVRVTGLSSDAKRSFVLIRDLAGGELSRAELTTAGLADATAYAQAEITLAAPPRAGEQVWRAVAVSADKQGTLREEASVEFRFTVRPHALDLNVWDLPSAIVAGEPFKFMVGIRCSSACAMSGLDLTITDDQGHQVAVATFAADPWPGTEALYAAGVQAVAPEAAGDHDWRIAATVGNPALPHAAATAQLRCKVVATADCIVTIEVLDAEMQTPIAAARVVMHPYRGTTNAVGLARLHVTKGRYDVLVAGSKYIPLSFSIDVTADVVTRAELGAEPPLEPLDEG